MAQARNNLRLSDFPRRVLPLRGGFLNVEVKKKSGGAWVMTMHLLDPTGAAAALGAYAPLLHGWITTGGDTWTLAVGAAVVLFIRIRML